MTDGQEKQRATDRPHEFGENDDYLATVNLWASGLPLMNDNNSCCAVAVRCPQSNPRGDCTRLERNKWGVGHLMVSTPPPPPSLYLLSFRVSLWPVGPRNQMCVISPWHHHHLNLRAVNETPTACRINPQLDSLMLLVRLRVCPTVSGRPSEDHTDICFISRYLFTWRFVFSLDYSDTSIFLDLTLLILLSPCPLSVAPESYMDRWYFTTTAMYSSSTSQIN